MWYTYILYSSKSKNFYFGYTANLRTRLSLHNSGKVVSTAPYIPWKLINYTAFDNQKMAKNFELYLKTGSGKAFAYKRLLDCEALKKDKLGSKTGIPKL